MSEVMTSGNPKQGVHHQPGRRWMTTVVALILLAMVSLFLIDRLYDPEKFNIEEIEVKGSFHQVDGRKIKESVEQVLDGNYFSTSLDEIETAVKKLPWVFNATVRRQWPSTLVVRVDEVQPIAEWGDDQWLNVSGDLVDREPWDHQLPSLYGPQSKQEVVWKMFQQWSGMFAAHGLSLERLVFDERELWYLTLSLTAMSMDRNALTATVIDSSVGESSEDGVENDTGLLAEVTMIVDNSDATPRIGRLIKALNTQLIAEFPSMKSIDLRYPNGFAINWIQQSPKNQKLTESN